MFGEDFPGGGIRGGDVVIGDHQEHAFAAVGVADAQVAQFAGVTQRDFPTGIDPVRAGTIFGGMGRVRGGFGQGGV